MEKAIVTFKNPDTEEVIEITLSYDKENSIVNYNVEQSEEHKDEKPLNFIGFLATMFLNMLKAD